MDDLLVIIEEQCEIIMQMSDRICRLARLLAEKYEVTQAEMDSIIQKGEGINE